MRSRARVIPADQQLRVNDGGSFDHGEDRQAVRVALHLCRRELVRLAKQVGKKRSR